VRKIVVHMQSTLDNRIANAQGAFWEPLPWGEPEVAYLNQFFRTADTLALSRVMYDAIVPWWDGVATGQLPPDAPEITPAFAEFAQLQHRMTKLVDEYLIAVHPALITAGPRMFDHLTRDLALELVHAEVFDAGSVVLHHRVVSE